MIHCQHCACMVTPGTACHGCGKMCRSEEKVCKCGGAMIRDEFPGGAVGYLCKKCGCGWIENLPPPVAVVLDNDLKIVPPSRSDEGFDIMGKVGRVRRATR